MFSSMIEMISSCLSKKDRVLVDNEAKQSDTSSWNSSSKNKHSERPGPNSDGSSGSYAGGMPIASSCGCSCVGWLALLVAVATSRTGGGGGGASSASTLKWATRIPKSMNTNLSVWFTCNQIRTEALLTIITRNQVRYHHHHHPVATLPRTSCHRLQLLRQLRHSERCLPPPHQNHMLLLVRRRVVEKEEVVVADPCQLFFVLLFDWMYGFLLLELSRSLKYCGGGIGSSQKTVVCVSGSKNCILCFPITLQVQKDPVFVPKDTRHKWLPTQQPNPDLDVSTSLLLYRFFLKISNRTRPYVLVFEVFGSTGCILVGTVHTVPVVRAWVHSPKQMAVVLSPSRYCTLLYCIMPFRNSGNIKGFWLSLHRTDQRHPIINVNVKSSIYYDLLLWKKLFFFVSFARGRQWDGNWCDLPTGGTVPTSTVWSEVDRFHCFCRPSSGEVSFYGSTFAYFFLRVDEYSTAKKSTSLSPCLTSLS